MPQVYELRQHIGFVAGFVVDKLQKRKSALQGQMLGREQKNGHIELQA
jgi:hypothetical protein